MGHSTGSRIQLGLSASSALAQSPWSITSAPSTIGSPLMGAIKVLSAPKFARRGDDGIVFSLLSASAGFVHGASDLVACTN